MPASLHNSEPAKTAVPLIELIELIRVSGRMLRGLLASHLQKHKLAESQFSTLWICRKAPRIGLSQQDVAAALAVSPAAVSGLVEQLRRRGLLEGWRAESDRRRQLWRLTPAGRDVLDAVLSDLVAWAATLEAQLERTDSGDLFLAVEQLVQALSLQTSAGSPRRAVPKPSVGESAGRGARDDVLCREGVA